MASSSRRSGRSRDRRFDEAATNTELWGTATIPNGTYVSALITLDYTSALITTMINGTETLCGTSTVSTSQPCSVLDTTGSTPTTFEVAVTFDPAHPLVVTPTYASTSATLMELNIDLGASGYLKYSGTTPEYIANPF
jgi:hypothetical protein